MKVAYIGSNCTHDGIPIAQAVSNLNYFVLVRGVPGLWEGFWQGLVLPARQCSCSARPRLEPAPALLISCYRAAGSTDFETWRQICSHNLPQLGRCSRSNRLRVAAPNRVSPPTLAAGFCASVAEPPDSPCLAGQSTLTLPLSCIGREVSAPVLFCRPPPRTPGEPAILRSNPYTTWESSD